VENKDDNEQNKDEIEEFDKPFDNSNDLTLVDNKTFDCNTCNDHQIKIKVNDEENNTNENENKVEINEENEQILLKEENKFNEEHSPNLNKTIITWIYSTILLTKTTIN